MNGGCRVQKTYLCWEIIKHDQRHDLRTGIIIAPVPALSKVQSLVFDCFLPVTTIVCCEEKACEIDRAGDGLQRALVIAVTRAINDLVYEELFVSLISLFP
jgi:hypothetical protein